MPDVLLLSGDPLIQDEARAASVALDMQIFVSDDGAGAIEAVQLARVRPVMVLIDLHRPPRAADVFLRFISQDPACSNVRLIGLEGEAGGRLAANVAVVMSRPVNWRRIQVLARLAAVASRPG